jgi:putative phosphoribosyl transferase
VFEDRYQAGKLLAQRLSLQKVAFDVVLAVPRGGIVVGAEISKFLDIPLKALVVKKVPTLGQAELAAGAIGPEGVFSGEKDRQTGKIVKERIEKFGRLEKLRGKKVVLVDDGIATGATIETAIKYLKKKKVEKIILAVPVAPKDVIDRVRKEIDEVIVLQTPEDFQAVGEFYRYFPQVTDEEVLQLLRR